jgi:hypothetical protein
MRKTILCIVIAVVLAVSAMGQVKTAASRYKAFADALEAQISCAQKPDPTKAIRSLNKAGIISRTPYNVVDSVSYFRVTKRLTVLGFEVYSVLGFDYNQKIFARGRGTSPGTMLGIVVPYQVEEVKSKLKNLDSQKSIIIDESKDEIGLKARAHVRTEIYCYGNP